MASVVVASMASVVVAAMTSVVAAAVVAAMVVASASVMASVVAAAVVMAAISAVLGHSRGHAHSHNEKSLNQTEKKFLNFWTFYFSGQQLEFFFPKINGRKTNFSACLISSFSFFQIRKREKGGGRERLFLPG